MTTALALLGALGFAAFGGFVLCLALVVREGAL